MAKSRPRRHARNFSESHYRDSDNKELPDEDSLDAADDSDDGHGRGKRKRPQRVVTPKPPLQKLAPAKLRVIAGEMRGRKIQYNGDPSIRPMKERTRESVFSLLGGYLTNTFAVDLFGGTGILAIESVSRSAQGGVVFELSRPAVSTIVENLKLLKLENKIEVHNIDTLRWMRSIETNVRKWPQIPWMIYCCPPYRMWHDHTERLITGINALLAMSPSGSKLVCETEDDFDVAAQLPELDWDIRKYQPAYIAIATRPDDATARNSGELDGGKFSSGELVMNAGEEDEFDEEE